MRCQRYGAAGQHARVEGSSINVVRLALGEKVAQYRPRREPAREMVGYPGSEWYTVGRGEVGTWAVAKGKAGGPRVRWGQDGRGRGRDAGRKEEHAANSKRNKIDK